MSVTWRQILDQGTERLSQAGIEEAKLDAWYLFERAFRMDRVHFLMEQGRTADSGAYDEGRQIYEGLLEQRAKRIPLQHLLGSQEFMGLSFFVNEHVLIPRQDTETLVELVLEEQQNPEKRILDLCTGSGCIAVSLAVKGGYRSVTASDVSDEALNVAKRNWENLKHACAGDQKMDFFQGDLFGALNPDTEPFDVITANPPYIPTAVIRGLEPEVRDHEPMLALDGTEDGLFFYRRIAAEAGRWLREGGSLYLEIGHDQGEAVSGLLRSAGFADVRVVRDLPGHDRVVCGRRI